MADAVYAHMPQRRKPRRPSTGGEREREWDGDLSSSGDMAADGGRSRSRHNPDSSDDWATEAQAAHVTPGLVHPVVQRCGHSHSYVFT